MPEHVRSRREQKSASSTSYLSSFIRWLQLKKYQYEVTFSLYMLTPTEKFIFNLILFVLISMLVTAASLYLPNHMAIIYNRIWYYVHGEFAYMTANGGGGGTTNNNLVKSTAGKVGQAVVSATSKFVAETVQGARKAGGEL